MALCQYKCSICGESELAFEEELRLLGCGDSFIESHAWEKLPPRVSTVIATSSFMLDEPQLDSLHTIYELDRQLNIEAREAKETELFQEIRRNL